MQSVLSLVVSVYIIFYVFEGVIRYVFHLYGADGLIFMRDVLLIVPLIFIFIRQFLRLQLHPAFSIFIAIILLHGTVMLLNIGSIMAVVYSIKMLMTILAGAVLSDKLFNPSRYLLKLALFLWAASLVGIALDKFYMEFPWTGMETSFEDIKVELGRDWQISGEDKRAGGFMRSSINAATVVPLLALLLIFNLRLRTLRVIVALMTLPALVWTTQKGPIVAFVVTLGIMAISFGRPILLLRLGICAMMVLMVALPVLLSGETMPSAEGVFSFSSMYQRIEDMWPRAWQWIHYHEAFPFGVGLGGISGAQRLYALNDMNAADNMFILMYAYFGVMTFVYLGFIALVALQTPSRATKGTTHALATLLYLIGYGCVISLLEDQMASLFLGAALARLCKERRAHRIEQLARIHSSGRSLARLSPPRRPLVGYEYSRA